MTIYYIATLIMFILDSYVFLAREIESEGQFVSRSHPYVIKDNGEI